MGEWAHGANGLGSAHAVRQAPGPRRGVSRPADPPRPGRARGQLRGGGDASSGDAETAGPTAARRRYARTPDVDLKAGTVTVRHSLRRVPVSTRGGSDEWWRLQAPKADSGRTIPLPRFVADALEASIEARKDERRATKVWAANDFVFADQHGGPVPFSTLDNWWKRALERAGLPDMRWHELRASTATILLAEGVPELTVMAILGHRSLEMTHRYVKLLPRVSRGAADRFDEVMGG